MPNICVFCGSALGTAPVYRAAAEAVGRAIARRGWGLVYGGATIGLMGAVELEPRRDQPTLRALDVFRHCFDNGVLVRTTGDTLALTPSLTVEPAQIGQIVDTIGKALRAVA